MIITKEQTQQIKGIAIILMIFLHLFNNPNIVNFCHPIFFIGDTPLVTIIARSCNPVGYFLIMSGYGLSYVYEHGSLGVNHIQEKTKPQLKRLFKLYRTYWFVLLIFVPIGFIINPVKYPGSVTDIISNITGWNTTYNAEMWFLFPYVMLSITSYGIFKLMDKLGNKLAFICSAILYFVSCFIISRYIAPNNLYHKPYVALLTYFDLLLSFVIGALFYRLDLSSLTNKLQSNQQGTLIMLILLFCSHFITSFQGFNPFFEALIIFLFLQLRTRKYISSLLQELGDKSTIMWMVHTYFAYYLFHDLIYGFKYPIIIFLVISIFSYIIAFSLQKLIGIIWKR